jgi:hypothetical protein
MTRSYMPEPAKEDINRELVGRLTKAIEGLDIVTPDQPLANERSISQMRRTRRSDLHNPVAMVSLTEVDGVLRWEDGLGVSPLMTEGTLAPATPGLRRGRRAQPPPGTIITQLKFPQLEASEIGDFLEKLDKKLTPERGLRQWLNGALQPNAVPVQQGRILLLVHGSFSNCDNFCQELQATATGQQLLGKMANQYDQVLTFDHPTVSVSPVLNALDLARLFRGSQAEIDIISHSRGGLVTRWWLEVFDAVPHPKRRAVLVGSPLRGTSLAAPDKLRAGLNMLTNVGRVLAGVGEAASTAVPFLMVATALIRVLSSLTGAVSKTPIVDAAIAMIPGLAGQSMISNNFELNRLNLDSNALPDYYAVRCDFQPLAAGWAFWKYFQKDRLLNTATDMLVFPDKNDLVVDTASMARYSESNDLPIASICDLGTRDDVYHTNYFRQPMVLDFIADKLQIQ